MTPNTKAVLLIVSVVGLLGVWFEESLRYTAQKHALSTSSVSVAWGENSSTITNDVIWTDKAGERIKANRGHTISKFGDYYYMVGSAAKPVLQECNEHKEETAGNIYIYKSKNLGSNSWEEVAHISKLHGEMYLDKLAADEEKGIDAFGCAMHQHPISEKFFIHCRTIVCTTQSNVPEDFNDESKYGCSRQLQFPVDPEDPSPRRGGDGRPSFRKGDDLYYVTIRVQEPTPETGGKNGNRKLYIYKLNTEWNQIEEITASRIWDKRENPEIVEHNNKFYLFASENQGWEFSTTHYLRSDTLEGFGLETAEDKVLQMVAKNTLSNENSFASQFTFIKNFGTTTNPKYMFAGRRHPVEDPCFMADKWGRHIMTPFKFDEIGEPSVYWRTSFNWKSPSSFDWESDDNTLSRFPKAYRQKFKPVCKATDDDLFCEYNPNPNPDTCRNEYVKKNNECAENNPFTPVPTISVPITTAPTTADVCMDSTLAITASGGAKCPEIAANIQYCDYNGIPSHCPLVCDACTQFECTDSILSWDYNGSSYSCGQLASLSDSDLESYCAIEGFYSTCRETCNTCNR